MHMSMFYRKGPMPISPESHQSIENNEKCTVFDTVTHHDDSRQCSLQISLIGGCI